MKDKDAVWYGDCDICTANMVELQRFHEAEHVVSDAAQQCYSTTELAFPELESLVDTCIGGTFDPDQMCDSLDYDRYDPDELGEKALPLVRVHCAQPVCNKCASPTATSPGGNSTDCGEWLTYDELKAAETPEAEELAGIADVQKAAVEPVSLAAVEKMDRRRCPGAGAARNKEIKAYEDAIDALYTVATNIRNIGESLNALVPEELAGMVPKLPDLCSGGMAEICDMIEGALGMKNEAEGTSFQFGALKGAITNDDKMVNLPKDGARLLTITECPDFEDWRRRNWIFATIDLAQAITIPGVS
eukprot:SAG31_NODE_4761_length_2973_cov_2.001740_3_plen_302_part_01